MTKVETYNGIEITLKANGDFFAKTAEGIITKSSLKSLKKALDDKGKSTFESFSALREANTWRNEDDRLIRIKIVGIKRDTSARKFKRMVFVDDSHGIRESVLADTLENVAAWAELNSHRQETRRIKEARDAEEERLEEKLQYIKADTFLAVKEPVDA
jgi:hypothetical protein